MTDESDFKWHACPFCKGSVGMHKREPRTAHTVPLCGGYSDFVAAAKARHDDYGLTSQPDGTEKSELDVH